MKTQFWDELLMGNVWTHTEPIMAAIKDTRIAYKANNYAQAGKHFGQALFKLTGGLVPLDENAIIPIAAANDMMPSEIATGLYYGVTGEYLPEVPHWEHDKQFADSITAAIEDLSTLTGTGLTNGFIKGMSTFA